MSQPWSPSGDMEPRRAVPGAHGCGPRVAAGSGTAAELVYHLAGALGAELQELARRFGPEAAAGLVPLVVQALELLEKAAVGPAPDSVSHGALPQPLCPGHCSQRGHVETEMTSCYFCIKPKPNKCLNQLPPLSLSMANRGF